LPSSASHAGCLPNRLSVSQRALVRFPSVTVTLTPSFARSARASG
jgi:hypothetical protein